MSFESLDCCLRSVAGLAEAFEVGQVIGTPICFCPDVVDRCCRGVSSIPQAFLTEMFIPAQYERTQFVPLATVTSLVAVQSALMLLPAFIAVRLAVTGAVRCRSGTSTFTAGARNGCRHTVRSNKKPPAKPVIHD